jgi:hypothetical protein
MMRANRRPGVQGTLVLCQDLALLLSAMCGMLTTE